MPPQSSVSCSWPGLLCLVLHSRVSRLPVFFYLASVSPCFSFARVFLFCCCFSMFLICLCFPRCQRLILFFSSCELILKKNFYHIRSHSNVIDMDFSSFKHSSVWSSQRLKIKSSAEDGYKNLIGFKCLLRRDIFLNACLAVVFQTWLHRQVWLALFLAKLPRSWSYVLQMVQKSYKYKRILWFCWILIWKNPTYTI